MSCQNLFAYSTYNEAANCYPYAGLCLGLLGGAAARACARLRFTVDVGDGEMWPLRLPRLPLVAITLLLTAWTSADRLTDDWWRTVQQFDRHTKFDRKLQIANASIYWGDPTDSSSHTVLRKEDFESTFNYLKACDKPFFVFKDATIFYGPPAAPRRSLCCIFRRTTVSATPTFPGWTLGSWILWSVITYRCWLSKHRVG
jgi:hypothetical protein